MSHTAVSDSSFESNHSSNEHGVLVLACKRQKARLTESTHRLSQSSTESRYVWCQTSAYVGCCRRQDSPGVAVSEAGSGSKL